jgi:hypothetical protein
MTLDACVDEASTPSLLTDRFDVVREAMMLKLLETDWHQP